MKYIKSKYLFFSFILFFSTISFYCQDKPPEVKVNNLSRSNLNIAFRLADCNCPSFTFDSVAPATITSFHELTTNKYSIKMTTQSVEVGSVVFLNPEMNKQYQVNIDTSYNCKIDSYDR
jgi:hypothetical protein